MINSKTLWGPSYLSLVLLFVRIYYNYFKLIKMKDR
jgi:hypothetical protein